MTSKHGIEHSYSLRGIVEGHRVIEFGWWIFKSKTFVVTVRMNEKQFFAFNKILRKKIGNQDRVFFGLTMVIEIDVTKDDQKNYPIGAEVGITLTHLHKSKGVFVPRVPFRVTKFQVMGPTVKLDNEVLTIINSSCAF
jgi:hypothetical protein